MCENIQKWLAAVSTQTNFPQNTGNFRTGCAELVVLEANRVGWCVSVSYSGFHLLQQSNMNKYGGKENHTELIWRMSRPHTGQQDSRMTSYVTSVMCPSWWRQLPLCRASRVWFRLASGQGGQGDHHGSNLGVAVKGGLNSEVHICIGTEVLYRQYGP